MNYLPQITLAITILLLTSCDHDKTVVQAQLVERDELVYEVNSESPFSGKALVLSVGVDEASDLTKLGAGSIAMSSEYSVGKLNGEQLEFHKNGQVNRRMFWKDGLQDGRAESLLENGQLVSLSNYKKGKRDGSMEEYFEDGKTKSIKKYREGELQGEAIYFYRNGQISTEMFYEKDHQLSMVSYRENGEIQQSQESKTIGHSILKTFHAGGSLAVEAETKQATNSIITKEFNINSSTPWREITSSVNSREEKFYWPNGNINTWMKWNNASSPFFELVQHSDDQGNSLSSHDSYNNSTGTGVIANALLDGTIPSYDYYVGGRRSSPLLGKMFNWENNGRLGVGYIRVNPDGKGGVSLHMSQMTCRDSWRTNLPRRRSGSGPVKANFLTNSDGTRNWNVIEFKKYHNSLWSSTCLGTYTIELKKDWALEFHNSGRVCCQFTRIKGESCDSVCGEDTMVGPACAS